VLALQYLRAKVGAVAHAGIGWKRDDKSMREQKQKFSVNRAEGAVFKPGVRQFQPPVMEYRDLGIEDATNGQFRAHVIRVKKDRYGDHDLHTTGFHQHLLDFQMVYVLKGWVTFIYDGEGEEKTFREGDCILQPAGIIHNELECSDDVEILEIYSPAVHETRAVDTKQEQAAK
jgi:uncharacterized protein YjlB